MIITKYKYDDGRFGICFESDKSGRKWRMFWIECGKHIKLAYKYLPRFGYFCLPGISVSIAW